MRMVACRNPWPDSSAFGGLDGEYVNLKNLSTVSIFFEVQHCIRLNPSQPCQPLVQVPDGAGLHIFLGHTPCLVMVASSYKALTA